MKYEFIANIMSIALIGIGIVFILFGVLGIFKFRNFYQRILITAKIDTVGVITLMAGIALRHGASYFTVKLILITAVMLIINPLANHMIARSAYLSGYNIENGHIKDEHSEEDGH